MNCNTSGGVYTCFSGDTTIPAILIAGLDDLGVAIPATNSGWVCRAQLLGPNRQRLGNERIITATTLVDTVAHFVAKITTAEADLMETNTANTGVKHYWSVEVENIGLGYRHTAELNLLVTGKP